MFFKGQDDMNNLLKISLSIFWLFAFMSLTSCSDNGSDGSGPSDPANGIWSGTFAETDGGTYEITAYLYDGRIIIFGRGFDGFDGNYLINGEDISADGNLYTYVHDIPPRYPATLSGTILARDSISATLSDSEGKTGSVSLNYDAILYNRSSSLSLLVGSWKISGITVTIDENGEISGQESPGCIVKGSINILNSSHNLYGVDFIIDCGHSQPGRVTGLSALLDSDTLQVAASNNLYFYNANWERLHEATELEGTWVNSTGGNTFRNITYIFSGGEYEQINDFVDWIDNSQEIPEGYDCDDVRPPDEIRECRYSVIKSGTFRIEDSFINSSGMEVTRITFKQEVVDGEARPETGSNTYVIQSYWSGKDLIFGDDDGVIDYCSTCIYSYRQ